MLLAADGAFWTAKGLSLWILQLGETESGTERQFRLAQVWRIGLQVTGPGNRKDWNNKRFSEGVHPFGFIGWQFRRWKQRNPGNQAAYEHQSRRDTCH